MRTRARARFRPQRSGILLQPRHNIHDTPQRRQQARHSGVKYGYPMSIETHVRILAWFNLVLGGLGALLAAVIFAGGSLIPALIATAAGEAGLLPASLLQFLVTFIVGIVLVLSLPSLILGYGLYNYRPWARILGLVLAAIHLFNVPLGTLISLYAFWVLLRPEAAALFGRNRP